MRCRVRQSMGLYEEAFGERVTGLADIIHGYRYHDGTVTKGSQSTTERPTGLLACHVIPH